MCDFDELYDELISFEGYYVNDTSDKGGETYCGISRVYNHNWDGWTLIDNQKSYCKKKGLELKDVLPSNVMLNAMVKNFYYETIFLKLKLDKIKNKDVVSELFDSVVNLGRITIKWLQMILNSFNYNRKTKKPFFTDLTVDGIMGSKTVSAINILFESEVFKNKKFGDVLFNYLNAFQAVRYVKIAQKYSQRKYNIGGWSTRISFI